MITKDYEDGQAYQELIKETVRKILIISLQDNLNI